MDGELDRPTMREVERFLDSNAQARRFVLDAMRTTVLLRAGSNEALHEPVPERLRQVFVKPATVTSFWREIRFPALKLAAAFALVVIGVGLGLIFKPGAELVPQQPFHLLPAAYQQVINQSLENHLSGDPLSLDLDTGGQRVVITPIKTYRNRDGHYYRGYYLELDYRWHPPEIQGHGLSHRKIGVANDSAFYAQDLILTGISRGTPHASRNNAKDTRDSNVPGKPLCRWFCIHPDRLVCRIIGCATSSRLPLPQQATVCCCRIIRRAPRLFTPTAVRKPSMKLPRMCDLAKSPRLYISGIAGFYLSSRGMGNTHPLRNPQLQGAHDWLGNPVCGIPVAPGPW